MSRSSKVCLDRATSYLDGAAGRIIIPQRSPHPKPRNLWVCYNNYITWQRGTKNVDEGTSLLVQWLRKVKVLVAQLCLTLCDLTDCPWNSLSRNTGVGCHSLLQGIFPTQGLNSGLLHCRQVKKPPCNARDIGLILVKELRSHMAKKQLSLRATT